MFQGVVPASSGKRAASLDQFYVLVLGELVVLEVLIELIHTRVVSRLIPLMRFRARGGGAGECAAGQRSSFKPGDVDAHQRPVHLDCGWPRLRSDVEQDVTQARTGHGVDDSVMHLGQDRDATVLEAFDVPQLPQRLTAVELCDNRRSTSS